MSAHRPLRILHVVGGMNRGGAESMIMSLYRAMDRERVQFDFAVQTDRSCHFDDEIRALGGRIYPHPIPHNAGLRGYSAALARTLRQHGPFVAIHSHVYHFSGAVLRVADRVGIPARLAHSHNSRDGQKNTAVRRLYRWYMGKLLQRHATHLLGCSRGTCEALFGDKCWRDPRVAVLPNGIALAPFAETSGDSMQARHELSLPASGPLIGHVGRFATVKNHAFIIAFFAQFRHLVPNAHLVLVGDGPLRGEIEALIAREGLSDSVHLLGVRDNVPAIMNSLDLFVMPSLYEGLPVVLIEAQAAGVPCLVSSNITPEADLGLGLVHFLPLTSDAAAWAMEGYARLGTPRPTWPDREHSLREAGYDVEWNARQLEGMYLSGR